MNGKKPAFYIRLFFIGLVLIVLGVAVVALKTKSPSPTKTVTPISVPNQRTIIGKTTDSQVQKSTDIISKEKNSNGTTNYTVKSVSPIYPDTIITQDGVVTYESTNSMSETFPKISDYVNKLGQPQEKIVGSKKYGALAVYYIYADKGIAFVGNQYTDNIYEFQRFSPMPLDQYLKMYGTDIRTGPPPKQ